MNQISKVQYVVVDRKTKKALYILTEGISSQDINTVGKKSLILQQKYRNSYVLLKIE